MQSTGICQNHQGIGNQAHHVQVTERGHNIQELRARQGIIVAIATEDDKEIDDKANHVLYVPEIHEMLSPLLTVIPLQLMAYYITIKNGLDVDQPRNLAKSVTVE